jgi:hypothetical protein
MAQGKVVESDAKFLQNLISRLKGSVVTCHGKKGIDIVRKADIGAYLGLCLSGLSVFLHSACPPV